VTNCWLRDWGYLQWSISVGVNFEVAFRSFRPRLLDVVQRRVRQKQIGREITAVSTMRPQVPVVQRLVDAALFISGMISFPGFTVTTIDRSGST